MRSRSNYERDERCLSATHRLSGSHYEYDRRSVDRQSAAVSRHANDPAMPVSRYAASHRSSGSRKSSVYSAFDASRRQERAAIAANGVSPSVWAESPDQYKFPDSDAYSTGDERNNDPFKSSPDESMDELVADLAKTSADAEKSSRKKRKKHKKHRKRSLSSASSVKNPGEEDGSMLQRKKKSKKHKRRRNYSESGDEADVSDSADAAPKVMWVESTKMKNDTSIARSSSNPYADIINRRSSKFVSSTANRSGSDDDDDRSVMLGPKIPPAILAEQAAEMAFKSGKYLPGMSKLPGRRIPRCHEILTGKEIEAFEKSGYVMRIDPELSPSSDNPEGELIKSIYT